MHDLLHEKCARCHLFIEENDSEGEGLAEYVHLTRGDEADEVIELSHDATPSGQRHTLAYWRAFGPEQMRARFTTGPHYRDFQVPERRTTQRSNQ